MTNREKYAEQILDIACSGLLLAVDKETMKPIPCKDISCIDCYFSVKGANICDDTCKEWCNAEYVRPPIDWSKVPVDTPILVRDNEKRDWNRRHFCKYENGYIYAYKNGTTSWSANKREECVWWNQVKLAEEGKNDE